jgi:hypothetical protein
MGDDEQRLIEEARRSREDTEELRKEAAEETADDDNFEFRPSGEDADSAGSAD